VGGSIPRQARDALSSSKGERTRPRNERTERSCPPNARRGGGTSLLRITIHEGRTRQVRNMCDAIGHPVRALRRVRIGPLTDSRLKLGAYRELTTAEVAKLKSAGKDSSPQRTQRHTSQKYRESRK